MAKHTLDIMQIVGEGDELAHNITNQYQRWKNQRREWEDQRQEIRRYIVATDTTKTTNANLPWKNTTTLPKLAQIRDNLHANYMAALFPHDDWFKWQAMKRDEEFTRKAKIIEAYMKNKLQTSDFRQEVSKLVYDYIDYGNAFAEVVYDSEYHTDDEGTVFPVRVGPRVVRISPMDIVFDISAPSFKDAPKITRTITTLGRLQKRINTETVENGWLQDAFDKAIEVRGRVGRAEASDVIKRDGFSVDGFSNVQDYYTSGYVEMLEFEGDIYDVYNDTLLENHRIIVIDRMWVAYQAPYKSWLGRSNKEHVGWRLRSDTLMAMGPLDNLVGMQYRVDHLENLKADVFDQIAHPVIYQRGNVEAWEWGPGERIYGDEESDVRVLAPDATALNADFQIQNLQNQMEEMAGAPRQAMGIRTPGEKTAFEVQALENAAGRIFQNKVSHFEDVFLEPLLNQMLEVARRNLDVTDQVRIQDDDLGVVEFTDIKQEDIQASGVLVPIGARHFARKNQLAQNLVQLTSSPAYQDPAVNAHISGKSIAKAVEELLDMERFDLVRENVRVAETTETAGLAQQGEDTLAVESQVGPEQFIGPQQ